MKKIFEKKMTAYFLLSTSTEKIVCGNKERLFKKAEEIASRILFLQTQMTGPTYHYEKVLESDEIEDRFIIRSRNCNSILQQDEEELVCTITKVDYLDDETENKENDKKEENININEINEKKEFVIITKKED